MNFKKILSPTLLCASALCGHAASVSFTLEAHELRDSNGDAMPVEGVVFLVASTTDSEFGAVGPGSYDVGDFLGGADDVILFRTDLVVNATAGFLFDNASGIVLDDVDGGPGFVANLTSGDPLALYWFPTTNNNGGAGSVELLAGADGGMYSHPSGLDGSRAWSMPASGSHDLKFYTSDSDFAPDGPGTGGNAPVASNAIAGFVIPEPSSLLSLALGSLLLVRRRR